ncbi:peptidase family M1-domain-containing protein, partial [Gorgonomyces haynaldii]
MRTLLLSLGQLFGWHPQKQKRNVLPIHYHLGIVSNIPDAQYEGFENITIQVERPTNHIELHSERLLITEAYLDDTPVQIESKEDTIVIHYSFKSKQYNLYLHFKGQMMNKPIGFFASVTDLNKTVAATHFEPFFARTAFPCFDVPYIKTRFDLWMEHPREYKAYGNTPIKSIEMIGNRQKTVFETTIPLSSYLVAWALENAYESASEVSDSGVGLSILYEKGLKPLFALDVGLRTINLVESLIGVKLPLSKVDIFPVPDFPAEGMENMGLISIVSEALQVQDTDSVSMKQYSALLVAHELAHFWFGNLVTMEWWDDLWLNEGFAEFMQFVICRSLFPEWDMDSEFFELEHQPAFAADTSKYTHPIAVRDPSENVEFDDVTYSKGIETDVIRMMAEMVNRVDGQFFKRLGQYVREHIYATVKTDELFLYLGSHLPFDFGHLMVRWIEKPGYPVVSVAFEHSGCQIDIQLNQSRFLYGEWDDTDNWWIPIS